VALTQDVQDLSRAHPSARAAVEHAIADLRASLSAPKFRIKPGSHIYLEMRRDMPYVIHDTGLAGTQILVNRDYKPLGNSSRDWVNYDAYPNLHIRLTASQIKAVVKPPHERGIFGDASTPWRGRTEALLYLERLELLTSYLK
jgi:hypothetical protein